MALPVPIKESKKEVFYEGTTNSLIGNSAVHFVFPPLDTYNNNGEPIEPYINRPNDKVVNADIAFLKLKSFEDSNQDSSWTNGNFGNTNVSGAFFAVESDDYFYIYTGSPTPISAPSLERSKIPNVAEAIKIPANSSGATFENKSLGMITQNVCRYDDIEVDGLNEGKKPTNQPMTAIRLENEFIEDVTLRSFDATPTTRTAIASATAVKSVIDADLIDELENEFVTEKTSYFTEASTYVGAVEIVNIERDVDDLRYGDAEDDLPFQFTGASYYFSDVELGTAGVDGIRNGDSTPVDIEVWGGDCFIAPHTFKISDSTYSLTCERDVTDTNYENAQNQTSKWEYYFKKLPANENSQDISRPFPLKGVSQTITVLLESEVNPSFKEKPQHNSYNYDPTSAVGSSNLPVPVVDDAGQIRSKFKYYFSQDYARQNTYKIFFPYQSFDVNNTTFSARIPYSDQKIYNSSIEGFDRFRALSFYDLDESHGALHSLVESGDRIFAIQDQAFSYVPVNAQIIESADGGNIAVQSGVVIGTVQKIDTSYGTQHPNTVKSDSGMIFFVDQLRGEVCMFDGQQVKLISRVGMESFFNDELLLNPTISTFYDRKNKEYGIYFSGRDSAVFSAIDGVWVSRFPENTDITTYGGARVGDHMMMIGANGTDNVYSGRLYSPTASVGTWWGSQFIPTVKMYVNPEPEIVKAFDGFTVIADRIIDPQSFVVTKSDGTLSTANLSSAVISDKEGTFRLKNLRDASNARSRGVYGELEIDFITSNQSGMSFVLTKYRPSFKPL